MSSDPLSPTSLLQLLEASIAPSSSPSSDSSASSSQQLRNSYDAIALLVHACMLAVGFRLIGLDEDDKLESSIDANSPNLRALPPAWNSGSSYGFRYAHSQSSLEFLIKVNRLGNKAVVFGLGVGDDKTTSFDFVVKDYLSENFFPYRLEDAGEEEEAGGQPKRLKDAFISDSRLRDLASLVKISIIQKLIPGLYKAGYEEEASSATHQRQPQSPADRNHIQDPQRGGYDPLRMPRPNNPYPYPSAGNTPPIPAGGEQPPGFDDEYEIYQPLRGPGAGYHAPGQNPLSIGHDDLNPPGLGPDTPLHGPFFGSRGLPGMWGGGPPMGGMHPTPDHPMFGGNGNARGRADPRFPPGARYDPVGPSDYNIPGRGTGLRGPRGPGGGGGPFGGGGFGGFGGGDFI